MQPEEGVKTEQNFQRRRIRHSFLTFHYGGYLNVVVLPIDLRGPET